MSTSTDGGATWTPVLLSAAAVVRDLAVTDDGTIVAFGWEPLGEDRNAPTAWSSTDGGTTWTATALSVDPAGWVADAVDRTPVGLVARVIGPDQTGHEWLSHDGVTWQEVLQTPGYVWPGAYGSEALLFGARHLWHSADGVSWEDLGSRLGEHEITASGDLPSGLVVAAGTQGGVADPGGHDLPGGSGRALTAALRQRPGQRRE